MTVMPGEGGTEFVCLTREFELILRLEVEAVVLAGPALWTTGLCLGTAGLLTLLVGLSIAEIFRPYHSM